MKPQRLAAVSLVFLGVFLCSSSGRCSEPGYLQLVQGCADVLIERGRDRYGESFSPLFMCVLDATTQTASRELPLQDGMVRTEGRTHRRNPGGSDLWEDQTLLRVLVRLTELTGDEKYRKTAEEDIAFFLDRCRKPSTGLPTWGSHIYWDAFTDSPGGDGNGTGPHETLIREAFWDLMWQVSPDRVREQIEGMWEWHVCDKDTGQHNRHDDKGAGCDFAFMGSELIHAFAFLHTKTNDPVWANRSRLVMNYHWLARDKGTNLAPDAPALYDRYDGRHCMTTLPGPHASLLLRTFALTGDPFYRGVALGHLRAYDKYAWDPEEESYWGMLALDGTPIRETKEERERVRDIGSYEDFRPIGHVDVWRTVLYSYEFPLVAAQSYAYAAELTGDEDMKKAVERWAKVISKDLPPKTGRRWKANLKEALPNLDEAHGTYAENYGRAISFFVHASHVLDRPEYLDTAKSIARDAIERLHHPASGLFLGHAAKGTYEATDGVGYLLYALLELAVYPEIWEPNL
jgi:hypothetical protein